MRYMETDRQLVQEFVLAPKASVLSPLALHESISLDALHSHYLYLLHFRNLFHACASESSLLCGGQCV